MFEIENLQKHSLESSNALNEIENTLGFLEEFDVVEGILFFKNKNLK